MLVLLLAFHPQPHMCTLADSAIGDACCQDTRFLERSCRKVGYLKMVDNGNFYQEYDIRPKKKEKQHEMGMLYPPSVIHEKCS